ncbi:MAG: hypothetical protein BWZ10_01635 [candidate division BRC1 bacterium ADurb.BinA364]|nr:MAG: hypothetical protein BWZ10_01635 [candidate division BRC1 bacterium ADurb.BinA364]
MARIWKTDINLPIHNSPCSMKRKANALRSAASSLPALQASSARPSIRLKRPSENFHASWACASMALKTNRIGVPASSRMRLSLRIALRAGAGHSKCASASPSLRQTRRASSRKKTKGQTLQRAAPAALARSGASAGEAISQPSTPRTNGASSADSMVSANAAKVAQ